ncbi:MAG: 3-carboxymuconate cyclase, partial [Subtercola sp.]|nr:3-carboxymuconate cyclase [Subtercola sp.]
GTVTLISSRPSRGGRPCQVAVHPSGRWIVTSNYAGATFTVIAVAPGGWLGEVTSVIEHQGRGIHPTRQDQPHPHTVLFTPDGCWALLVDVGLDTISVHAFDRGRLEPEPSCVARCSPGAGPRHAIWLTDHMLAVDEEISGTLSTFAWNGRGRLVGPISTVSSTHEGASDAWPSEIQRVDGRSAFVANRARGLLTAFSVRPAPNECSAAQCSSALESMRDIALPSPNVRHFWADSAAAYLAMQDSDRLVSLDLASGSILDALPIGSPAYVAVVTRIETAAGRGKVS